MNKSFWILTTTANVMISGMIAAGLLCTTPAYSAPQDPLDQAQIQFTDPADTIEGLTINESKPELSVEIGDGESPDNVRAVTHLKGVLEQQDSSLLLNGKGVKLSGTGENRTFDVEVELDHETVPCVFSTVEANGETETLNTQIRYPAWDRLASEPRPKKFHAVLAPLGGINQLNLTQSGVFGTLQNQSFSYPVYGASLRLEYSDFSMNVWYDQSPVKVQTDQSSTSKTDIRQVRNVGATFGYKVFTLGVENHLLPIALANFGTTLSWSGLNVNELKAGVEIYRGTWGSAKIKIPVSVLLHGGYFFFGYGNGDPGISGLSGYSLAGTFKANKEILHGKRVSLDVWLAPSVTLQQITFNGSWNTAVGTGVLNTQHYRLLAGIEVKL